MGLPPNQAYEIDLVASEGDDYLVALVATITGVPKADILAQLPEQLRPSGSWRSRSFIDVAQLLRFNCNRQFIAFDARTPWPCVLRCYSPTLKNGWWALAYANGAVYDPWEESVQWLDDFLRRNPEAYVTSMLQIWMP